jgi:ferredoxin
MVLRDIVKIDESKCNGCGECIPTCVEGALQVIDGKARLVKDVYCDGLGACLGHCPQDAIRITQREAAPFDEEAVHEYIAHQKSEETSTDQLSTEQVANRSQLSQWPVQLNLVPLEAPFFDGKELLIMADCVPVAYPDIHNTLLKGRSIVIGCPKLDDIRYYIEKLTEIISRNKLSSLKVVHMEVPCCSGLKYIAENAVKKSGKDIPISMHVVTIRGDIA